MSADIVSAVIEGMEEDDDLKDIMLGGVSEADIKYWSNHMRSHRFATEEEARTRLYDLLQHSDKSPGPFEPWGEAKNRWFSQAMPVYQDRFGKWRIGAPLMTWVKAKRQDAQVRRTAQEKIDKQRDEERFKRLYPGWRYPGYGHWDNTTKPIARRGSGLGDFDESFHSDFSDGTGGEPSAAAPFTAGQGEQAGLPDYKYMDRLKKRREKLAALIQRRDPDGIEQRIGEAVESNDDDDLKDLTSSNLVYEPYQGTWPESHRVRTGGSTDFSENPNYYLGDVWKQSSTAKVPALQQLDQEFPWTAQAVGFLYSGAARFRSMEEAGEYLRRVRFKENRPPSEKDFVNQWNQLARKPVRETSEDEDFKDLAMPTDWRMTFKPTDLGGEKRLYQHISSGISYKIIDHNNSGYYSVYVYDEQGDFVDGKNFNLPESNWIKAEEIGKKLALKMLGSYSTSLRRQIEEASEDEDFKDLEPETPWIDFDAFVKLYDAIPVPGIVASSTFHKYWFGHRDMDLILRVAEANGLDQNAHIWTLYAPVARHGEVYLKPGMRYEGGWSSLEKVYGWFLTRDPAGSTRLKLNPHDVSDNSAYIF